VSGPDDTFLDRWSRRKQAVKAAESAPPEAAADEVLPVTEAERRENQIALPEDAAAGEPAEQLPSIEELTAESDISAFLRKGVPEVLRKAALRKAWSLDPAIRDFVGPADYAWDFNNPASIPGFGAASAGAALEKLAVLGATPSLDAGERAPAPEQPREAVRLSPATEAVPEARPTASETTHPPVTTAKTQEEAAPPSNQTAGGDEARNGPARPRHGGALPR